MPIFHSSLLWCSGKHNLVFPEITFGCFPLSVEGEDSYSNLHWPHCPTPGRESQLDSLLLDHSVDRYFSQRTYYANLYGNLNGNLTWTSLDYPVKKAQALTLLEGPLLFCEEPLIHTEDNCSYTSEFCFAYCQTSTFYHYMCSISSIHSTFFI